MEVTTAQATQGRLALSSWGGWELGRRRKGKATHKGQDRKGQICEVGSALGSRVHGEETKGRRSGVRREWWEEKELKVLGEGRPFRVWE